MSIGIEKERTLHATLKKYIEPDTCCHEVGYLGYIADIKRGNEIVEIQTRCLSKMKDKLDVFLRECKVTVVHPIARKKYIHTIDEESGEELSCRKSPKNGRYIDAMRELYTLREFLGRDGFTFRLILVDTDEFRRTDRKKRESRRGAVRIESIPREIVGDLTLDSPEKWRELLSDAAGQAVIPENFTSADLAKILKVRKNLIGFTIGMMKRVGTIKETGKTGRSIIYSLTAEKE